MTTHLVDDPQAGASAVPTAPDIPRLVALA
jgi:hypothetical protein